MKTKQYTTIPLLLISLLLFSSISIAVGSGHEDEEKADWSSIGAVLQGFDSFVNFIIDILYGFYYFIMVALFLFLVFLLFYIPIRIYRDYYIPNKAIINRLLQLTRH